MVGEELLFPTHSAALLNGTFAHSMDFDDTHRESVIHPGTPVFAALLALGEATGARGRGTEFIAAAAAGYEVSCRVGKGHREGVHRRGFHPSATTGIFGATAACARLLGAVKPYPCCRYNHGIIDAVLALVRRHGISAADVAGLEIGLNRVGLDVVGVPEEPKKAPENVVDGQFSAYFAAAIALLEGRYTWECYGRLRDPEVVELMARMRAVEVDIPLLGARVTATTRSGQRLTAEVPLARGSLSRSSPGMICWPDIFGLEVCDNRSEASTVIRRTVIFRCDTSASASFWRAH